jgi:hypothetical protein
MTFSNIFRLLMARGVFLRAVALSAEDRIWLEAKINGKPARLCFDSGCNYPCLTTGAAKKLGLKVIDEPTNDIGNGVSVGETEEVTLRLEGSEWNTSFQLLDVPPYVGSDFDGLIGWLSLSHFRLPAGTKLKLTLKRDEKIFNTTATLREIVKPGAERKRSSPILR